MRVRFDKVVKDNKGSMKKIKRVNITRLAYAVIEKPLLEITPEYMLELLSKNKQSGSDKKAIKEVARALDNLETRLIVKDGPIVAIGHKFIVQNGDLTKHIDWTNKLSAAVTVLKGI